MEVLPPLINCLISTNSNLITGREVLEEEGGKGGGEGGEGGGGEGGRGGREEGRGTEEEEGVSYSV